MLKEYFLKNGCSNLDISIFTHMHMDHCKGAMELGEVYPVKQYMVPYPYRYQVKGRHVNLVRFRDKIRLEKGVWIEAIWPMDDRIATSESDDNELNTVYILHYKGVKIMLTGDLVEADEPQVTLDERYGKMRPLNHITVEVADDLLAQAIDYAQSNNVAHWNGQVLTVTGNPVILRGAVAESEDAE